MTYAFVGRDGMIMDMVNELPLSIRHGRRLNGMAAKYGDDAHVAIAFICGEYLLQATRPSGAERHI